MELGGTTNLRRVHCTSTFQKSLVYMFFINKALIILNTLFYGGIFFFLDALHDSDIQEFDLFESHNIEASSSSRIKSQNDGRLYCKQLIVFNIIYIIYLI